MKRELCRKYADRLSQKELCSVLLMTKSSRYYKKSDNKPGAKPSEFTYHKNGEKVSNDKVVDVLVKEVLSQEFNRYGHRLCNEELKALGFTINHKKTYRLMKKHGLLLEKVGISGIKREWVKYRKIVAAAPYEHICMDIKYIYIHGLRTNAYLLAIIDVATRYVLGWSLRLSMKYQDVILCLHSALSNHTSDKIMLRTDNGSQFVSHGLDKYCKTSGITHEFTHVATPEENSYVESLFSCVEKEVVLTHEFDSLYHAREVFKRYFIFHNTKRRRHALGRRSPMEYWNTFFSLPDYKQYKAEAGVLVKGGEATWLALDKYGS